MASPIKKSTTKKYSRSMSHLPNKRDEIRNKRFQNNNKYYLINAARSNSVKVSVYSHILRHPKYEFSCLNSFSVSVLELYRSQT